MDIPNPRIIDVSPKPVKYDKIKKDLKKREIYGKPTNPIFHKKIIDQATGTAIKIMDSYNLPEESISEHLKNN